MYIYIHVCICMLANFLLIDKSLIPILANAMIKSKVGIKLYQLSYAPGSLVFSCAKILFIFL